MGSIMESMNHESGSWGFSAALASCLKHYGYEVSEPMAFGLSATLGFSFVKNGHGLPSRSFYGINTDPDFYYSSNIREKIEWKAEKYFPWDNIKECLKNGIPVIVLTNPFYLPYSASNFFISGHTLLILGYNETQGQVTVADNMHKGLKNITIDELAEAMNYVAPPLMRSNYWAPVAKPGKLEIASASKRSIIRTAINILYPKEEGNGIDGIRSLASDIKHWQTEIKDKKWSAAQCLKAISGMNTDGGNYRFSYSAFLKEAEKILPELSETDAADRMEYCGRLWQELGAQLTEYINSDDNRVLQQCSRLVIQIAREEEGIFKDLLRVLTGKVYEREAAAVIH